MELITPGADQWDNWTKLPGNSFIHQVQAGRLGKNIGLRNGLNYINNFIYGTQKARYYLIGADSGVGKTTLADFMFILQAYKSAKAQGRKFKCFYCSFEIGKADKIARWASYYVYQLYKIRLPSDYILGRIEGLLLSSVDYGRVIEAYKLIEEMMEDIIFIDMMMTPSTIFNSIVEEHFAKRGTVLKDTATGQVTGYIADDPNYMTMLAADHLALTDSEGIDNTKTTMDKLSKYAVILRNLFHCTIVFIQQFSTDMLMANRTMHTKKTGIAAIAPSRLDFGDSKATFRDADVILGGICPGRDMSECMGFDLTPSKLGTYMILVFVMKNRYGKANKVIPLFMDPITGIFADMPLYYQDDNSWYDEAQKIEQVCQAFSPRLL